MTTDNRTNEQTIEAAARVIYDHSAVNDEGNVCQCGHETGHDLAFHQAERLHAAGRLAGEPAPEQVRAAVKAYDEHWGVFPDEFREYTCRGCGNLYATEAERKAGVDGEKLSKAVDAHRMHAALVAAASVAPAVQQVSESDALALVDGVIAIHADRIGTHYEDCYKYHVACLAVAVKHRLGGER